LGHKDSIKFLEGFKVAEQCLLLTLLVAEFQRKKTKKILLQKA